METSIMKLTELRNEAIEKDVKLKVTVESSVEEPFPRNLLTGWVVRDKREMVPYLIISTVGYGHELVAKCVPLVSLSSSDVVVERRIEDLSHLVAMEYEYEMRSYR